MITVARRYQFRATHHLPGFNPPWNEPHEHLYTVEVVADSDVEDVVDTDDIDRVWRRIAPADGADLNEHFDSTTVEALAVTWLAALRDPLFEVREVTVWEDDSRWGRASL